MDNYYWLFGLLGAAVVVAVAFWLWWLFGRPLAQSGSFWGSGSSPGGAAGHSVWCYQGGSWGLVEDRSRPGFAPGPPPTEPGQFDGHCVKVISVRRPEGP